MNVYRTVMLGIEPNLYPTEYLSHYEPRSATIPRPKPKGVELLFDGTSANSKRVDYIRCRISDLWGPDTRGWFLGSVRGTTSSPNDPDLTLKLLSQIKNQKVNIAQFLAEAPTTLRMFQDFAMRVLKARKYLKKGQPLKVLAALAGRKTTGVRNVPPQVLGDAQLAFTYGVKPLISDLNGAVSELLSNARARPFIFSVRARGQSASNHETTISPDTAFNVNVASRNVYNEMKHAVWKAYVEMDKPSWLNDGSRLGFLNPVALLWELIPLSFVVDWFFNVGECLSNLDSLTGVKRVGVHRTVRSNVLWTTDLVPRSASVTGGQCSYRSLEVRRTFISNLSVPVPSWEPYLSFSRILSGLALARGR